VGTYTKENLYLTKGEWDRIKGYGQRREGKRTGSDGSLIQTITANYSLKKNEEGNLAGSYLTDSLTP